MEFSDCRAFFQSRFEEQKGNTNESGPFRFLQEQGLVLSIEYDSEKKQLFLYTALAEAPKNKNLRQKVFQSLLEGNLFHMSTGLGTLSFDEETDLLIYFESLPFSLIPTEKELAKCVESFTSYALYWMEKISEELEEEDSKAQDPVHSLKDHALGLHGLDSKTMIFP